MTHRKEIKRQIRLLLRAFRDARTGARARFAGPSPGENRGLEYVLSLRQPIRPGASVQNKLINIRLACERIRQVTIRPGQVFSFWYIVGNTSETRGFRRSRNIVGRRLGNGNDIRSRGYRGKSTDNVAVWEVKSSFRLTGVIYRHVV